MSASRSAGPRPGSFRSLLRRPAGWAVLALFLAAAGSAIWLQSLHMQRYKQKIWYDAFVLPKPEYVEKLSLGYNAWFADFLFLRAIQAFGGTSPATLPDLAPAILNYFEVIAALDPHFLEVYTFGALVVGDQGGRNDLALGYLKTGQWHNWRRYAPWAEAAIIKVTAKKEHDNEARYYVRQAAKAVDATQYISHWESYIDESAGEFRISLDRWLREYAHDYDVRNDLAPLAWRKIESILEKWPREYVQQKVDQYHEERGKWPASLEELEKEGYFGEWETISRPKLVQALDPLHFGAGKLSPRVDQILKAATVKLQGIPAPLDPAQGRFVLIWSPVDSKMRVATEKERENDTKALLAGYRDYIRGYYAEHKAYPKSVEGVTLPGQSVPINDLYGNAAWDYDPATGEIHSRARPDL